MHAEISVQHWQWTLNRLKGNTIQKGQTFRSNQNVFSQQGHDLEGTIYRR